MREKIEKRLEELQQELAGGEKLLAELQAKQADLQAKQASVQQTMLRIGGAIRVLQELLEEEAAVEGSAAGNGSARP